jgi:hypothetical protein
MPSRDLTVLHRCDSRQRPEVTDEHVHISLMFSDDNLYLRPAMSYRPGS